MRYAAEISEKNDLFFRAAAQIITYLSAGLQSRWCIFEQEKTGKEERIGIFIARLKRIGPATAADHN